MVKDYLITFPFFKKYSNFKINLFHEDENVEYVLLQIKLSRG